MRASCTRSAAASSPSRVPARYGTTFGVAASQRALVGSVSTVPVVGSTQGHGLAPKKERLVQAHRAQLLEFARADMGRG